ncbi:MAG: patatin-like phospholipase family protein [Alphaproteobacteria bacterium]|jgi:NTE family protein
MKKINLALQGGGSHGAYTWGVLDRLLEEKELEIEGISGTSAGAMNAAILVNGYEKNGRAGAKKELEEFWHKICELGKISPVRQMPIDRMTNGWNLDWSLSYNYFDMVTRLFSPYEINPVNINPLQTILEETLDVELLGKSNKIKLFISTTNVKTGRSRVFNSDEITVKVLLASACLPWLFQAIEIDGDYYWDGGYMGNPSLWPLIYGCESRDILLIQINPLIRAKLPVKAHEITNRISEISFNASLVAEMRAIHFVSKMVNHNALDKNIYKNLHLHMIESSEAMQELNASSKLNTSWQFFIFLKEIGRNAAERWLKDNYSFIGTASSLDIEQVFFPAMHEQHPYIDEVEPRHPLELPETILKKKPN